MAALSIYAANKILDHLFTVSTWAPLGGIYMALFTSGDGLQSNTLEDQTEVNSAGYSRVSISGRISAASGGVSTNSNVAIPFPTALSDWGMITHFAVMDAVSSGNVLVWGELETPVPTMAGDSPSFIVDNFSLSLS